MDMVRNSARFARKQTPSLWLRQVKRWLRRHAVALSGWVVGAVALWLHVARQEPVPQQTVTPLAAESLTFGEVYEEFARQNDLAAFCKYILNFGMRADAMNEKARQTALQLVREAAEKMVGMTPAHMVHIPALEEKLRVELLEPVRKVNRNDFKELDDAGNKISDGTLRVE